MTLNWRTVQGAGSGLLVAGCLLSGAAGRADDGIQPVSCPCESNSAPAAYHAADWGSPPAALFPAAPMVAGVTPASATVTPPPGTLGTTYHRQSWPIPADRHPRVAMLDVRAPAGATNVRVFNTYEYREEDEVAGFQDVDDPCIWHFETDPLIPGIPHVYRIEADVNGQCDARWVRLIRGRRVVLEF
jgi:hypothetical protein